MATKNGFKRSLKIQRGIIFLHKCILIVLGNDKKVLLSKKKNQFNSNINKLRQQNINGRLERHFLEMSGELFSYISIYDMFFTKHTITKKTRILVNCFFIKIRNIGVGD